MRHVGPPAKRGPNVSVDQPWMYPVKGRRTLSESSSSPRIWVIRRALDLPAFYTAAARIFADQPTHSLALRQTCRIPCLGYPYMRPNVHGPWNCLGTCCHNSEPPMLIRSPHVWKHPSCDEFMTPFAAPELTRQVNDKQVSRVWILSLSAGIAAAGPAMRSRHIQLVVIGALFEEDQCICG